MQNNSKAGNINDGAPYQSCAYGIDCSGFVGRVWGIAGGDGLKPISTYNIKAMYSRPLTPVPTMGDAYNYYAHHVMIFASNATNGINAYESTGDNNWDRVVYDYRPWSQLAGYELLRSLTSCF